MPILNSINQMQDEMKTWRQELHRIPEIGLEEYKTSSYIKEKLKKWGIEYKDGYSNTGIAAWPPFPLTTISNSSTAAIIGPVETPNCPSFNPGQL